MSLYPLGWAQSGCCPPSSTWKEEGEEEAENWQTREGQQGKGTQGFQEAGMGILSFIHDNIYTVYSYFLVYFLLTFFIYMYFILVFNVYI